MKRSALLLTSILLAACARPHIPTTAPHGADATTPESGSGLTAQSLTRAHRFMAASANPLATEAGYEVLQRGGSAVDAMIAIQATLGLVEPQSSGLGGGAYVVYWDNQAKKLTSFDARETAPQAATPSLFLNKQGKPLDFMNAVVGGRSVGTPGVPKLLEDLHRRYGKQPWSGLFARPIELAEQGFTVSPRMAASIQANQQHLSRYPATAAYFLPGGRPLTAGSLLKNPAYAQSLQQLATQGSRAFYHGQPMKNIVAAVQGALDNPGKLAAADFHRYRIIERTPVCSAYREYEICGMGGSSSGGLAVGQIMGILNQFSPQQLSPDQTQTLRLLGDASRLAFADRDQYAGDPDFIRVPYQQLLDPAYLKQRAQQLKATNRALPEVRAGQIAGYPAAPATALELPSTSHIVIVDSQGNVLSMTTSIENAFGSTLMANGYLLNNELTDFSFEPTKNGIPIANRVEGGKRPRSSMAPTIVMKNGQPYLAVGSPGGSRIIGYVAKTLLAHIDWGLDIQQAITYPNLINRFGTYELEQNTAAADYAPALAGLGYPTQIRDLNSGVQGIIITPTGLQGGADPRREGKVMGE